MCIVGMQCIYHPRNHSWESFEPFGHEEGHQEAGEIIICSRIDLSVYH